MVERDSRPGVLFRFHISLTAPLWLPLSPFVHPRIRDNNIHLGDCCIRVLLGKDNKMHLVDS